MANNMSVVNKEPHCKWMLQGFESKESAILFFTGL